MDWAGEVRWREGERLEAERLHRDVLRFKCRLLTVDHRSTADTITRLATILHANTPQHEPRGGGEGGGGGVLVSGDDEADALFERAVGHPTQGEVMGYAAAVVYSYLLKHAERWVEGGGWRVEGGGGRGGGGEKG